MSVKVSKHFVTVVWVGEHSVMFHQVMRPPKCVIIMNYKMK